MGTVQYLLARPRPPDDILTVSALLEPDRFVPAPALLEWIRTAYLDDEGSLFTEEHSHLAAAKIGCLWTTAENMRRGQRIVGFAELGNTIGGRQGKWQKGRAEQQVREWFGYEPDFLITFDALHADQTDDASFCALVDHELFHCAQAKDKFDQPRFNKATGEPIWGIRGHDLEEFVAVVRRFGVQAAAPAATDLVIAAAKKPEIAAAKLARACGTCIAKAA
ncbi:hypothetical protein LCGC14_2735920 [marine sediment metagenome]|uniref:Putative phage metallopeptidase domain-containing protein n=1 Tax=marine sediment metagenome TaxID=412755 RepID=A0A0F9BES6_9ZZZZ